MHHQPGKVAKHSVATATNQSLQHLLPPMRGEPRRAHLVLRQCKTDLAPECWAMVRHRKVRQFVHDDVVHDRRREQHGRPVEVHPPRMTARAPSVAEVAHGDPLGFNPHPLRPALHPTLQPGTAVLSVPFAILTASGLLPETSAAAGWLLRFLTAIGTLALTAIAVLKGLRILDLIWDKRKPARRLPDQPPEGLDRYRHSALTTSVGTW